MESKQLKAYKQYSQQLVQFIIRLTKFYEGFRPDIDEELQSLRSFLAGTPNFARASASIDSVVSLIQHADVSVAKFTKLAVTDVESVVKFLQQQLEGNSELKDEATRQLIALNQPVSNLFSLFKLLQDALELYKKSFNVLCTNGNAGGKKLNRDASLEALYKMIYAELTQIVSSYAQKKPNDPKLHELQQLLNPSVSEDTLLQSCIALIRLLGQDAMAEASFTGKVIQNLHKSLGTLSSGVNDTIVRSKQQFDNRQASNEAIRQQLDSMENAVSQSHTLESVKQRAQDYMNEIVSTLDQQEETEREEQHALLALLSSMQSQINQLQTQTNTYRKKLAAQVASGQTDALTKLPNRQAYNERIEEVLSQSELCDEVIAIAVVDVDHFKNINDQFGHSAGDKTLQVVAQKLRQFLDAKHFLARWGGEEFALILFGLDDEALFDCLEGLRQKLAALPFKFKQQKLSITASFGATIIKRDDTPESAFNRADKCLYAAKKAGRNRIEINKD